MEAIGGSERKCSGRLEGGSERIIISQGSEVRDEGRWETRSAR